MSDRDFLRHTLATLAYRAAKALRDAPPGFATMTPSAGSRTPAQILAHMGDLFDWALSLARGQQTWKNSTPLPWDAEVGATLRRARPLRRLPRRRRAAACLVRAAVSGANRRCPHPHRAVDDAPAGRRQPDQRRELRQGRHRRRPRDRLAVCATRANSTERGSDPIPDRLAASDPTPTPDLLGFCSV